MGALSRAFPRAGPEPPIRRNSPFPRRARCRIMGRAGRPRWKGGVLCRFRRGGCTLPEVFWPILTTFVLLVLAGVGAPIPEEVPTMCAGIWVANRPELGPVRWLILPVCYAGVILSDVMLYGIGRLWG